jgi:hypothetical protein
MQDLILAAQDVQAFLDQHGWRFCFIGGLALQRWGIPRLTRDMDISLFTGFGQEDAVIGPLIERFPARIPDPAAFARRSRVLLLRTAGGIGIDIALAGFPFEEEIIQRATMEEYLPGIRLRICSAEDLVVLKAFADRTQDWADIEGILARQGQAIDRAMIRARLAPLAELKEAPHLIERWESLTGLASQAPKAKGRRPRRSRPA